MCADADVQKMQENRKKREDMCMQKNDTVVVEITDIGVNGEGIGKIDGYTLFIKDAVIGDVADYIIFMAYDEYGESSTKSGTTAGYDWVELGIKKFLETEEVEPEKLVLAVPLYTRLWTEDSTGKVIKKSVVSMKDIDKTIPSDVERKWDDKLKQYYVEYNDGNNLKKMWIEDIKSLKEKVSLITNYKLGGVASWEKGMETDEVWELFKEALK